MFHPHWLSLSQICFFNVKRATDYITKWNVIAILNYMKPTRPRNVYCHMCTCVCSHLLLGNENFLRAINDEVSTRVKRTFIELSEITVSKSTQHTVRWPQHDGNLADECLLMLCFYWVFSFFQHRLCDVHIQRCRVAAKWGFCQGNR